MADRARIFLKKGRENSLRRRHPWVFSGAIQRQSNQVAPGELVDVYSESGSYLGSGHWGTKSIAVRILSFQEFETERQVINARLENAIAARRTLDLIGSDSTTGFRLVHAEGDELPGLIVDVYGAAAVVQCHSTGMWRLREDIRAVLLGRSELKLSEVIFRRVDAQVEGSEGDTAEPALDEARLVPFKENGLLFFADITTGQKTGFFLDQRESRAWIRDNASGKRVLNAFCYSGAFSVYALAGGAKSVYSVDASKNAISACSANVAANFPDAAHESEAADCFEYLPRIGNGFDIIILDPPAFVKHQRALERGLRGYETINTHAFQQIKDGGVVATFSCSQLVSRDAFRDVVMRAAARAGRTARIIHNFHQASCHPVNLFHPEGEYLKGFAVLVR